MKLPNFYDIVMDQTTPGLTYEPAKLTPSTEYFWNVSGIDQYANIGDESETRHFITAESSGIGDGTVTYTVSPNTGDSRTAAITIAGQTHTVNQEPASGSLKVTIYPPEAVSAGARWRVDGGDWNSNGHTQNGLSIGNHQLEFNTIPGWITPASQTATINNKKDQNQFIC